MPKFGGFDYNIYRRFFKNVFIASSIAALTACATTTPLPNQTPAPVVQRAPVPDTAPAQPTTAEQERQARAERRRAEAAAQRRAEQRQREQEETELAAQRAQTGAYFNNRGGLTPPHMTGRDTKRLALLLPFSARSSGLKAQAASMLRAAELAIFEREDADVLLIALDTKGTTNGTRSATQTALDSGADIILGPIIADNVKAAARIAASSGTPLLAFSNDQSVAGNGTYLLSFPPEAEVNRIVEYVASTGTTRFAVMGPDSTYGRRVNKAYEQAVRRVGGEITARESYKGNDISVMQEPAQRLAAFHATGEKIAKANGGITPLSYEAILLPEGGNALRSLAPLFPYYEVDPADVQFMGTGRWNNSDTAREPALNRGIFAGPDKDAQQPFMDNYDRTYGENPSSLATLAYDAVTLGAYIADGDPKTRRVRAEDPAGFYGVDGLVSFGRDGRPNRGLAVYKINYGEFTVIDPAPRTKGEGLGDS
ncbi:MAG: penicillin-binding protein activator [Litorimonas sp.]